MKMVLKLFFLTIVSFAYAEFQLQGELYGLQGRFQVTACSRTGAHCEGAILLADYAVVLNSCIRKQDIKHIYVQMGIANCTQEGVTPAMEAKGESSVRNVVGLYSHPNSPDVDLALLKLDWPYMDYMDNQTLSPNALKLLEIFLGGITYPSTEKTHRDYQDGYMQKQYHMQSSPIKMFFVTVILPSVSFIVFFLFIVFFTGTSDTSKIHYKALTNEKKPSHV